MNNSNAAAPCHNSIPIPTIGKVYIEDLDNTEKLRAVIAESDILINATRAGMAPLQDVIPVPEDVLRPELAVADVVYNPLETLLVKKAKEAGCRAAIGGIGKRCGMCGI